MLPGPVLVMLRVLSWLSLPLWPAGAASAIALDVRGVVIVSSLALAATLAALMLHMHDRTDARIAKGLAAQRQREAEIALLAGAMIDSGMVTAVPIQRPAGEGPDLRVVQDRVS